jgi:hypothetical protein
MAHNFISWFAFCSVIVLNALSVIGEILCDQESLTTLKLCCIAVPTCNLIGLAFLSRVAPTALQFDLLAVCEYVVVIGACIGTALYSVNFRGIQVLLCIELPHEGQPQMDDLPAGLIQAEGEPAAPVG